VNWTTTKGKDQLKKFINPLGIEEEEIFGEKPDYKLSEGYMGNYGPSKEEEYYAYCLKMFRKSNFALMEVERSVSFSSAISLVQEGSKRKENIIPSLNVLLDIWDARWTGTNDSKSQLLDLVLQAHGGSANNPQFERFIQIITKNPVGNFKRRHSFIPSYPQLIAICELNGCVDILNNFIPPSSCFISRYDSPKIYDFLPLYRKLYNDKSNREIALQLCDHIFKLGCQFFLQEFVEVWKNSPLISRYRNQIEEQIKNGSSLSIRLIQLFGNEFANATIELFKKQDEEKKIQYFVELFSLKRKQPCNVELHIASWHIQIMKKWKKPKLWVMEGNTESTAWNGFMKSEKKEETFY